MDSDTWHYNAVRLIEGATLLLAARESLAERTASAAREDPKLRDALYEWLGKDWPMVRVLHLISVGYSGTPTFYRATTATYQREGYRLGLVEFHSGSRVYVLTSQGRSALAQWTQLMEYLKEDPHFAGLWTKVTVV